MDSAGRLRPSHPRPGAIVSVATEDHTRRESPRGTLATAFDAAEALHSEAAAAKFTCSANRGGGMVGSSSIRRVDHFGVPFSPPTHEPQGTCPKSESLLRCSLLALGLPGWSYGYRSSWAGIGESTAAASSDPKDTDWRADAPWREIGRYPWAVAHCDDMGGNARRLNQRND